VTGIWGNAAGVRRSLSGVMGKKKGKKGEENMTLDKSRLGKKKSKGGGFDAIHERRRSVISDGHGNLGKKQNRKEEAQDPRKWDRKGKRERYDAAGNRSEKP